jgi:hypothetical protein
VWSFERNKQFFWLGSYSAPHQEGVRMATMKKEGARLAIVSEYDRWAKKHPDEAIMMGGFLFFRYLQNERPDLLDFRGVGDKWRIVHGWLRDRLEEINADAIWSRQCCRKICADGGPHGSSRSSEPVGVSLQMTPLRFRQSRRKQRVDEGASIAANAAKLPELSKPEVI